MKFRTLFLAAAVALLAFGRAAGAAGDPLLSAVVGSGANTSYLTLDFRGGPGVAQTSYAFAYRYDGAKTGGDLIDALVGANVGFSAGFTQFSFGRFFTSFGYAGSLLDTNATPSADDYWAFWDGPDGDQWNSAQTGPDDFALVSGGYVGLSYAPQFPSDYQPLTPRAGSSAVPEPSTLALGVLGLAALGAVVRRRRA